MDNKVAEFFRKRSVKIAVAVLSGLPAFTMLMKLFSLTTDSGEVIKFSAYHSAEVIVNYGDLGEIIAVAVFGPIISGAFVLSVFMALGAVGMAFFKQKSAVIISYALSFIPNLALMTAMSVLNSLISEMAVTYSPLVIITLLWNMTFLLVSLSGIVFTAVSKNK